MNKVFIFNWIKSCLLLAFFSISSQVIASTQGVVISQVYGGNGNTFNRDYVELFNASASPVDISGWSIQYSSATGTGLFASNGITALNGTLQAGQYYLVGLASAANGAGLPVTDATGTSNLSGTNGKVVLVNNSAGLTCNGGSAPCSPAQVAEIVDLVGYGSANFFETSAAPVASTSLALFRANNGCTDSDQNNSDFSTGTPAPRNSGSSFNPCGGSPLNAPIVPSCGNLTVDVGSSGLLALSASDADSVVNQAQIISVAVDGIGLSDFNSASLDGGSATVNLLVNSTVAVGNYPVQIQFFNNEAQSVVCTSNVIVQNPLAVTPIYTIQGSTLGIASVSPLSGSSVVTEGIVTAKISNGFYLQDEVGDNNPLTSDGVFVFGNNTLALVNVGDKIRLHANVTEFNTVTELVSPSNLQILSTNHPVIPVDISLPEVTEGDIEAYEGMLVRIVSPMTVSQNFFQGRYGQVSLSAQGRLIKPTNIYRPGTQEAINLNDENARRRITLDDGSSAQNPNPIPFIGQDNTLRAGDIAQTITGVIDHGLITASSSGPSDYKIHATETPVFTRENPRTAGPEQVGGNVKVASFNVLNYFTTFINGNTASGLSGQGCSLGASVLASNCRGANNATEFTRQRDKIINAIAAINADVVGLMEIQNNGSTALQDLVNGLNAKVGENTYALIVDPVAGMGTDAIKVAMIYKPAKVSLVGNALSDNSLINSRPTLAQTFTTSNGEKFSVLVNHFKSKGCGDAVGADLDQNDGQGCYNATRTQQAQQLATFIQTVKATALDDDVLIIGDLNAYGKEDPIDTLDAYGYTDQIARFDGQAGYSYVFDGEAGYLDHALANNSMAAQISNVVHWHINTDEPSVIDYNTEFKPQDLYTSEPYRSSDHDPVVIGLNLYKSLTGTSRRDNLVGTTGDDVITGGLGADVITTGAGNDVVVYQSLRDAIDTITDFTPNADVIDLSVLLTSVGYVGGNPFADGYVALANSANGTVLTIDSDGNGPAVARTLLIFNQVSASNLDLTRDFIW